MIKLTSHLTLSIYTSTDIQREFEAAAKPFWKEWAEFKRIIIFLLGVTICKSHAQSLFQTYGAKGQDNINKLEELFTLLSDKKIRKSNFINTKYSLSKYANAKYNKFKYVNM